MAPARRAPLALALLLVAIYLATASGTFHSIDEESVFAVARTMVYQGRADQSLLFWDTPYLAQGRIGVDGEFYSKYGIGHALVLTLPIQLARAIPGASLVATATLVNGVATALTALLLARVARRLGYAERVGITIGLLYGLATFAWVYARTMFSEPLVALGLTAGFALLLPTPRRALAAGVILAATVAIRPAALPLLVPLALLLPWRSPARALRVATGVAFPVGLAGIGLLLFNQWRFGVPLEFGYSERFDGSLTAGLVGFLFSLDRSLFIFAPPLLALPWSLPTFLRRHGRVGWGALWVGVIALLLYSQWPVFWGGPVWGPRYLLPALPLLVLLLAPGVERAWGLGAGDGDLAWGGDAPPRRPYVIAFGLVVGVGLLVQLPGVVWNSLPQTQMLGQRYPLLLLRPRAEWLDVVWLESGGLAGGMVALLLVALAAWGLLRPTRWRVATAGVGVGALLLVSLMGNVRTAPRPVYAALLERLVEEGRVGDALLLDPAPHASPLTELGWFMDARGMSLPFYGVTRTPPGAGEPTAIRLARLLDRHERLWLLSEGVAPGEPTSTTEQLLLERGARHPTEWLDEGFRLTLVEQPASAMVAGTPRVPLGDRVMLEEWAIAPGRSPGTVQLALEWRVLAAGEGELHTYAQLLDTSERVVAGWDQAVLGGFAPAPGWRPGQRLIERVVLTPDEPGAGRLRLVVGLVEPETGARLRAPDGTDAIELARVEPP